MAISIQDIRKICTKMELWHPGVAAVTDLGRFRYLLPETQNGKPTEDGELALERFNQYVLKYKEQGRGSLSPIPPMGAKEYLSRAARLDKDSVKALECSHFSYSAIAAALLNDEIRKNYDVCQVGIMRDRNQFKHNICVLIPKSEGKVIREKLKNSSYGKNTSILFNLGDLPKETIIIDPWARSLGHPVEKTLAVYLKDFYFDDHFDPFIINYNSGNDPNLEEAIQAHLSIRYKTALVALIKSKTNIDVVDEKVRELIRVTQALKREGKEPLMDLIEVLEKTRLILNGKISIKSYQNYAQMLQEKASTGMQLVGKSMMELASFVLGLAVGYASGQLSVGILGTEIGLLFGDKIAHSWPNLPTKMSEIATEIKKLRSSDNEQADPFKNKKT